MPAPSRPLILLSLLACLSACAPAAESPGLQAGDPPGAGALPALAPLPAIRTFGPYQPQPPARSNVQIAQDILDLEFLMESGRPLASLTRFKGPITIGFDSPLPAEFAPVIRADLDRLIARFRTEAGLDVSKARPGTTPTIAIDFRPRAELGHAVPSAACFVVPNAASFADYTRGQSNPDYDWTRIPERRQARVFIPDDISPQEIRDCLHEELAQAMGPLNDLYRLSDSVFNDDNFHAVLTGFDMLALKVHYAPELANGMSRAEVAAQLPALLAQLNPAGEGLPAPDPLQVQGTRATTRAWTAAAERAFESDARPRARLSAAEHLVDMAQTQGWHDSRLAFAYFALGRALIAIDPDQALLALFNARQIYGTLPETAIHIAHIDMQIAAIALAEGQNEAVLTLTDRAIPAIRRAQNAALLATVMLIRAEALHNAGRKAEARAQRLDSLGWARYGFGPQAEMRERMADIAALGAVARRQD